MSLCFLSLIYSNFRQSSQLVTTTMFYGYMPSLYSVPPNPTSSSTSPSKSTTTTTCCSSTLLLEVLLYLHSGLYLLAVALAVSVLNKTTPDQHQYQQAVELVVVGISGAVTTAMAISGLWLRLRQFLLPLVVFLFSIIVLDSISIFYYYMSSPSTQSIYPDQSLFTLYPNTDHMVPYLVVKLVFSIWLVKRLTTMYRKNLTIRTGRSPLRKQTQPSGDDAKFEEGETEKGSPMIKAKVGLYSKFENCQEV